MARKKKTDEAPSEVKLEPIPAKFTDFAAWCGVGLTPAQLVFCLVCYDGMDPIELTMEQREIAREIFGDVDRIPPMSRNVIVAMCGARAGKTMVFVAMRVLHLALTVPVDLLAKGEVGAAFIVAPDLRLARQALRYCRGLADSVPAIRSRIMVGERGGSGVKDGFVISRENNTDVFIQCMPATAGGSAVRGHSLLAAAMDEAAFFRNSDNIVNDADVLKAMRPRVVRGGQTIISSTPWEESGVLYEMYKANFGSPAEAIAATAPTELMRPDEITKAVIDAERKRDPDNARREFDAIPFTGSSSGFFPLAAIESAIDKGRTEPLPHYSTADTEAGADFAFRRDSSALAIVQVLGDTLHVSGTWEVKPSREAPLKPSEVVREFAITLKAYDATTVVTDGHYIDAVSELMEPFGITTMPAPGGQTGKVAAYIAARSALVEGRVRLPDDARLIAQLKSVSSRPQPGGGISITSPRQPGGHGDIASALVLALWKAAGTAGTAYESYSVPARQIMGYQSARGFDDPIENFLTRR